MTNSALSFGKEIQLTEGTATDIRWNADSCSLVFEQQERERSRLFRTGVDEAGLTALDLCNTPSSKVQGRSAFFGQDDFAFDRRGTLSIWPEDLTVNARAYRNVGCSR